MYSALNKFMVLCFIISFTGNEMETHSYHQHKICRTNAQNYKGNGQVCGFDQLFNSFVDVVDDTVGDNHHDNVLLTAVELAGLSVVCYPLNDGSESGGSAELNLL